MLEGGHLAEARPEQSGLELEAVRDVERVQPEAWLGVRGKARVGGLGLGLGLGLGFGFGFGFGFGLGFAFLGIAAQQLAHKGARLVRDKGWGWGWGRGCTWGWV